MIPTLIAGLNPGTVSDRLREAAESFLGESEEHAKWDGHDFAKALSLRFPSCVSLNYLIYHAGKVPLAD